MILKNLFSIFVIIILLNKSILSFSEEFSTLKRVDSLIEQKDYDKALNVINTIDKFPEFPVEYVYLYKANIFYKKEKFLKASEFYYLSSNYNILKQDSLKGVYKCLKKLGENTKAFNVLTKIKDIDFISNNTEYHKKNTRIGNLYKRILKKRSYKNIIDQYIKIYKPKTFFEFKYIGKLYFRSEEYTKAIKYLKKADQLSPSWIRKEEVLKYLGVSFYKIKKYLLAAKYFNVLKRSKNYLYQMEAYNYLYSLNYKLKNKKNIDKYEKIILQSNPIVSVVAEKHLKRGFDLFRKNKFQNAYGVFYRIAKYCKSSYYKADALFWCGYCMEKLNKYSEARKYYERIWKKYEKFQIREISGLRNIIVLSKLKEDKVSDMYLDSLLRSENGSVSKFYLNECANKEYNSFNNKNLSYLYVPELKFSRNIDSKHFQLAIKFAQAGLKKIGELEINQFISENHSISRRYLSALFLNWLGKYRRSVYYAEIINKNKNRYKYSQVKFLLYPIIYYEYIKKYCEKYKVDPFLALAVIREESTFNENALSNSGARGLMQLMPSTAKWLCKNFLNIKYSKAKLFDPEFNIRLGVWYLSYLSKQFDKFKGTNKIIRVIASYNGGIGNVRKWDKYFKLKDPVIFSELMKLPETRYYVKKVLRSYLKYHDIYIDNNR